MDLPVTRDSLQGHGRCCGLWHQRAAVRHQALQARVSAASPDAAALPVLANTSG